MATLRLRSSILNHVHIKDVEILRSKDLEKKTVKKRRFETNSPLPKYQGPPKALFSIKLKGGWNRGSFTSNKLVGLHNLQQIRE